MQLKMLICKNNANITYDVKVEYELTINFMQTFIYKY